MRLFKKLLQFEGFEPSWQRLLVQGGSTLFVGIFMMLASAVNPDALILNARGFSWLPVLGMFILILGLLECIDAVLAKQQRDVIQNLQVGVLDTVVGLLMILSISGTVSRLSLLISAFLIVRGIVRMVFVYALKMPYSFVTSFGGMFSILMGALIFLQWPVDEGWIVSFFLSIEIAFRGWAGISFALWIKKQKKKTNRTRLKSDLANHFFKPYSKKRRSLLTKLR